MDDGWTAMTPRGRRHPDDVSTARVESDEEHAPHRASLSPVRDILSSSLSAH